MATTINPEKSVDVPPRGDRNPDPITDAPGSHPVETGIGAAVGGAASGLAVGAATGGPVGAVIGTVVGAVAGGYAGKGIGELIDPTTEDNWLRENYTSRPYYRDGDTFDTYTPAYRYGAQAEAEYGDQGFDTIEGNLEQGWQKSKDRGEVTWDRARGAVRDAYDRSCHLRKQRQRVS